MLNALTLLVGLQLAGEALVRVAAVPLPGPVVGLVLLLGWLGLRERLGRGPDSALRSTAMGLLGNLSLLFVPAGVGVITQLDVLGRNWLPVAGAIVLSTLIGILVTAAVMVRLDRDA